MAKSDCLKNPWGHLRGIYETSDNHLNKVKIDELVTIFSNYFNSLEIYQTDKHHNKKNIDPSFEYEQEKLLTPEIKNYLEEFSDEMLLSRGYLVIGRKWNIWYYNTDEFK